VPARAVVAALCEIPYGKVERVVLLAQLAHASGSVWTASVNWFDERGVAERCPCPPHDPGAGHAQLPTPSTKACQWWGPCRPRVSTGVAPGRVHCGTGRLVGPQVAFPSASERQYQHAWRPSGQPSGLSSHASPRP